MLGSGNKASASAFRNVVGKSKTRQLQIATGGRYQYLLLSKIVHFLKNEYLESREIRPTMEMLLEKIGELNVSDNVKQWLAKDALPKHPRIRVVPCQGSNGEPIMVRFAYQAPLKLTSDEASLLKVLKMKHKNNEGGLLRNLVEDSIHPTLADRHIKSLLKENKVRQITRLDNNRVLFYKAPEPELDQRIADIRFVELWRKVDVCNKEMSHIKTFLKNQKLAVFDEDLVKDEQVGNKRKATDEPVAAPAPNLREQPGTTVKDNVHVQDDLMEFPKEL